MKIFSVLFLTALASSAVPAFSQTMTVPKTSYKPGETIQMTVKFDSALDSGSMVSVRYHLRSSTESDQKTFSGDLRFQGSPSSGDNKTVALQAMVDNTVASGEYVFGFLAINKEGFRPGESDTAPNAPVITIKNSGKDEKQLTVPPFSIQVK
jgi:hypothetical protein